ncbi:restriction endonuclease [Mycobacterium sp. CBMA 234]|uniref:BglII/BstYI family type II restriction endonuclease n=1 Tax=Mycolicibacterium sp. CBMA 234 TaxID=1918495 RepID=UPI001390B2B6|nr:BglII/BstYI family type II restriction endonuclease [Mycolicibacterium sp. CBMA 234]MUL64157.1 restriction endonuclease [Mycolicibacterium sp. CBMA 234]
MDLTDSYTRVLPQHIRNRYEFIETRNAAAILAATNPGRFDELLAALHQFQLRTDDLVQPGGQETELAARLNTAFRDKGWREARVDTRIRLELRKMPHKTAGETLPTLDETEVFNEGYKVDNFVDRVALDVEWNAKDGNLDRDLSAYRALYDAALIDVAVIITRTQTDLRALGYRLGVEAGMDDERARRILATTTTTNTEKLRPRMQRGDSGGCPLLTVAICARTWADHAPGGEAPDTPHDIGLWEA